MIPKVPLKVRYLSHYKGKPLRYETPGASGFDVSGALSEALVLQPGKRCLIPTGISLEIPKGYEVQVRPRSGLALKKGLSVPNAPGTIDCDYRGEVKVILVNLGDEAISISPGERVAQLVLAPVVQADFVLVKELSSTQRDAAGFGSTGV